MQRSDMDPFPDDGFLPLDLLVSHWRLDAHALVESLRPSLGGTRVFYGGGLADDLGRADGPVELVALAERAEEPAEPAIEPHGLIHPPVQLSVLVMPTRLLRAWEEPLRSLLTHPGGPLPPVSPEIAKGMHALHGQRDLQPGSQLFAQEMEEAHIELWPLFTAARAVQELGGANGRPAVRERLSLLVRALLSAWDCCNPQPELQAPLFERAAARRGISPGVRAAVRQALTGRSPDRDVRSALRALEEIGAADPVLGLTGYARDEVSAAPQETRAALSSVRPTSQQTAWHVPEESRSPIRGNVRES
ncbi:hypothetical protein [Nonomuraea diastatica]|uniref:Uncharacterized protein n=1 Tax=Nonomuraea diastatica TaxID=1848329 RepID=A0A4R4X120_9ACTN|nr:hypothetical protein [Nonomuraea diastatica]TDD23831.1 hypothetical protein E1294_07455 [Nonomuraea diastatica]